MFEYITRVLAFMLKIIKIKVPIAHRYCVKTVQERFTYTTHKNSVFIYYMCAVIISSSKNNHSAEEITIVNNLIVPKNPFCPLMVTN